MSVQACVPQHGLLPGAQTERVPLNTSYSHDIGRSPTSRQAIAGVTGVRDNPSLTSGKTKASTGGRPASWQRLSGTAANPATRQPMVAAGGAQHEAHGALLPHASEVSCRVRTWKVARPRIAASPQGRRRPAPGEPGSPAPARRNWSRRRLGQDSASHRRAARLLCRDRDSRYGERPGPRQIRPRRRVTC